MRKISQIIILLEDKPYSVVMSWINIKLYFSLLIKVCATMLTGHKKVFSYILKIGLAII